MLSKFQLCTHNLSIMDIVSTGVPESPSVEVWQSAQGALEVVLMDTGFGVVATSQDHAVCHLYCTRLPVSVMIMTQVMTQMEINGGE